MSRDKSVQLKLTKLLTKNDVKNLRGVTIYSLRSTTTRHLFKKKDYRQFKSNKTLILIKIIYIGDAAKFPA